MEYLHEPLSVAPMMEISDRHWRAMLRKITRKTVLYTEMIVDHVVLHNEHGLDFFLGTDIDEHPSVIQLGGHEVESLSQAAQIVSHYGKYSEINLNCGCPSARVVQRCFGARLMLDPELVRQIVFSMQRMSSLPITVKCRIGVDSKDSYDELTKFIQTVHTGGVKKFVIHARKCLLNGLSTKQNRDIPPLKYDIVHSLVKDFPELQFILNGGLQSLDEAASHMHLDDKDSYPVHGAMIGRAILNNPLILANADSRFYGVSDSCYSRRRVLEGYMEYCDWAQSDAGPTRINGGKEQQATSALLLKPVHNIMVGLQHNSRFKVVLNDVYVDGVRRGETNPNPRYIIEEAMKCLNEEDLDCPIGNYCHR